MTRDQVYAQGALSGDLKAAKRALDTAKETLECTADFRFKEEVQKRIECALDDVYNAHAHVLLASID